MPNRVGNQLQNLDIMKKQSSLLILFICLTTIANAQVKCFKTANFTGESMEISKNWVSKGASDPWNDKIHSIQIDPGWSIVLYEHVNNAGDVSEIIPAGNWTAPSDWNKKISSIAVMRITDKNGNPFNTKVIGNKIWMEQNLEGSNLKNCAIEKTVLDNKSPGVNFYDGKSRYAYYNNDMNDKDPATGNKLGSVFSLAALKCPICPDGYRVASESEWMELFKKAGNGDAKKGALALRKRGGYEPLFIYTAGRIDSYGSVKRGVFVQYWTKEGKILTLDGSGYSFSPTKDNEQKMGLYVRCLTDGQ